MDTQLNAPYWKKFFWVFLPSVLSFGMVLMGFYWYTIHTSTGVIKADEKNSVKLYSEHIDADISAILSDLKFLANQRDLLYVVEGDAESREELEVDYLYFIKEKGFYDQVRFLDKSGMERIRINYNSGASEIVPAERLQNKFSRYYFADTFALGQDEIYISPFDLNIEGGKIEQPLKPMIRFGTPIFDSRGEKQGVLLFNYLSLRVFNAFAHSESPPLGGSMLLNKDGYWLKGIKTEDEWGFMYPDRQDVKFQNRFAEEWQHIINADSGQFINDNGLFTFETVRPLQSVKKHTLHPAAAINTVSGPQDGRDYYWKIVSMVSSEDIKKELRFARNAFGGGFMGFVGLLFALSSFITRNGLAKERVEKAIQEQNSLLQAKQSKLESALDEINENHKTMEKAYHDLQSAQTQLLQAEKMQSVGRLAAGVAHEINTPIQFIGDNLNFILDSFQDLNKIQIAQDRVLETTSNGLALIDLVQKMKETAEEIDLEYLRTEIPQAIQQSIEGIAKIVRAMKEFSHPGSEEKSHFNLNKAIENAVTVSKNEWKYHAELELDLDPELPQVLCLGGELNQAILNLIVNAGHALASTEKTESSKKGLIQISTRQQGDRVKILVSDNGTGIPEAIRSKIFDPFFTTKNVGQGTGQGLAIVYSTIVDKHYGTIELESEVGKGTTFIIHLPVEDRCALAK